MALTPEQRDKLVKLGQLETFKNLADETYQGKILSESINGLNATTVEEALAELVTVAGTSDVSFEKLDLPNAGKLATYRFTKGSGANAQTMEIDIEKDLMRAIVGFVTITEDGGHYYDGQEEVSSAQGVTSAGIYLKSYELDAAGQSTGVVKYADASLVIEYLTLGNQEGKAVTLNITNNAITADIANGAIQKAHLSQELQDAIDLAATALQEHQDISGKLDRSEIIKNGVFDISNTNENGTVARILNEADGGGIFLTDGTSNVKSFVGVNEGGANGGPYAQIYAIDKDSKVGTRMNTTANGIFYSKGRNSSTFTAADEIATKGDIEAGIGTLEFATDEQIRALFGLE